MKRKEKKRKGKRKVKERKRKTMFALDILNLGMKGNSGKRTYDRHFNTFVFIEEKLLPVKSYSKPQVFEWSRSQ